MLFRSQWRKWEHYDEIGQHYSSKTQKIEESDILRRKQIDQIQVLIDTLKIDPDSRRLLVNAWNVSELEDMVLPPCHYGFECWTRELTIKERITYWFHKYKPNRDVVDHIDTLNENEKHEMLGDRVPKRELSLKWIQRSVDVPLGLPFNIASYGLLLLMLADEVNMIPGELIGSLGNTHIYLNQIDGVKEQLHRDSFNLPTVHVRDGIYCSSLGDVILENYISQDKIDFPLSN